MGKRGPKPTPTAILEKRGSWRAKTRAGEPKPPAGSVRMPSWLDPEAKRAWQKLRPDLEAMGVFTRVDANTFARYCQLWARWRQCEKAIRKLGHVVPRYNDDGDLVGVDPNPHVAMASRLSDQLLRMEQQFGLTPSARASLAPAKLEEDAPKDDKAAMLRFTG